MNWWANILHILKSRICNALFPRKGVPAGLRYLLFIESFSELSYVMQRVANQASKARCILFAIMIHTVYSPYIHYSLTFYFSRHHDTDDLFSS